MKSHGIAILLSVFIAAGLLILSISETRAGTGVGVVGELTTMDTIAMDFDAGNFKQTERAECGGVACIRLSKTPESLRYEYAIPGIHKTLGKHDTHDELFVPSRSYFLTKAGYYCGLYWAKVRNYLLDGGTLATSNLHVAWTSFVIEWAVADFPDPFPVQQGTSYYLRIRLEEGNNVNLFHEWGAAYRLYGNEYHSSGEFISRKFDVGASSNYGQISWSGTTPSGTGVKLQIRTADAEAALDSAAWHGPTGTSDYYTNPGQDINPVHDGDRWVQCKAVLSTSDPVQTPDLKDVAISFTRYALIRDVTAPTRVNVGSEVTISGHAYLHGSEVPAQSQKVYSNGVHVATTNSDGSFSFTTSVPNSPIESNYVLTLEQGLGARPVSIIADRVKITDGGADRERVGEGSFGTVWFMAVYEFDSLPFDGSSGSQLYINDRAASWNVELGRWELSDAYNEVVRVDYSVSSISDERFGLTSFNDIVGTRSIVWDAIRVVQGGPIDGRVDLGSNGTVWFKTIYESDSSPLDDTAGSRLFINGEEAAWDSTNSYWRISEVREDVGAALYSVSSVFDGLYGVATLKDDVGVVTVIWDELMVTEGGTDDARVDTGSAGRVWFRTHYAYDGEPFDGDHGRLYVNETAARWDPSTARWEFSQVSHSTGKRSFLPTSVDDKRYGLVKLNVACSAQTVVWDQVTVSEILLDSSVLRVGEKVNIGFRTVYAYDGEPFTLRQGEIYVAGERADWDAARGCWEFEDVSGEQTVRSYHVSQIVDDKYGITSFDDALLRETSVVWGERPPTQVIVFDGGVSSQRVNTGDPVTVWFLAQHEDGSEFDGGSGTLRINGEDAHFDPTNKRWEIEVSFESVGEKLFSPTVALGPNGKYLGLKNLIGSVFVVFDRLDVKFCDVNHATAGEAATISFGMAYAYDGEPFTERDGLVYVDGKAANWNEERTCWEFRDVQDIPTTKTYAVSSVHDNRYGLTVFDDTVLRETKVVWTEEPASPVVVVKGGVSRERVGVGDEVIAWFAVQHEDGTVFDESMGKVRIDGREASYNDHETRWELKVVSDEVGRVHITPTSVSDRSGERIGMKNLIGSVSAVFDRAVIVLRCEKERVSVGEKAPISIDARYEYDGEMFDGSVQLDHVLTQNSVGRVCYGVEGIHDNRYGLTVFTFDPVSVIFDCIEIYEAGVEPLHSMGVERRVVHIVDIDDEVFGLSSFIDRAGPVEVVPSSLKITDVEVIGEAPRIGTQVEVRFRAVYDDGSPFTISNGVIYVNDRKATWNGELDCWEFACLSDEAVRKSYSISDVEVYDDAGAVVWLRARYACDHRPFRGRLLLSDGEAVYNPTLDRYEYYLKGGVKAFDVGEFGTIVISWLPEEESPTSQPTVGIIEGGASPTRIRSGETVIVWFRLTKAGEELAADDGVVYVNASKAMWNPSARRWEIEDAPKSGLWSYVVSEVRDRLGVELNVAGSWRVEVEVVPKVEVNASYPKTVSKGESVVFNVRVTADGEPFSGRAATYLDGRSLAEITVLNGRFDRELKNISVGRHNFRVAPIVGAKTYPSDFPFEVVREVEFSMMTYLPYMGISTLLSIAIILLLRGLRSRRSGKGKEDIPDIDF